MGFHATADAPHLAYVCVSQHPIAFEWIANIDDTARLCLQAFRCVVGEFGQGFCGSNADAYWDARSFVDGGADGSAKCGEITGNASQIREGLIYLKERL